MELTGGERIRVICNDCKGSKKEPGFVRGVSALAGGGYYNGPEICEKCAVKRRETNIAFRNFRERMRTASIDTSFYHEC